MQPILGTNFALLRGISPKVKWSLYPVLSAILFLSLPGVVWAAEKSADDVMALVNVAVKTELDADQNDRSRWRYRDDQQEIRTVSIVVQTDAGSVKRTVSRDGRTLTSDEQRQEDDRLNQLIHDSSRLAKQHKDSMADDKNARDLLQMLPEAFTWKTEAQDATTVRLHFEPRPDFHPPSLQARVLSAMNGIMVVDKKQHHIVTLSGRLTQDVTFGFGLFGRLMQGGTFRVERREVAPGLWQITETHVHIEGKALLFKTIGQQQDEVQTNYTPVPHGTTLEQAVALSRP